MAEKLVVIGGTAAGLSAASKAKRLDPSLEITVFERSGYISYGACGLPYFVGGLIEAADDLVSVSLADMNGKRGVPTFIHREVTKIDRARKQVEVKNLDTGEITFQPYDKLVIATGAAPVVPKLAGAEAENLYCLRTVEDGIRLKKAAKRGTSAVIIGGGFIGLETAEELAQCGVRVTLCEMLPRLCPFLPERYSEAVKGTLEAQGVTVCTGTAVERFMTRNGRITAVVDSDGKVTEADFVLSAIGVKPASQLAQDCGLALGVKGGIVVDDGMRTADASIFACGDCIQTKNSITNLPVYMPLGTNANKQGRVAGENAAGGSAVFPGVLGSMVTKVFDCYIACTGLTALQAREAGFDAVETDIVQRDRASYYPGACPAHLNLVFEKGSGRLLGAQGLGANSIAGRINALAVAITAKMTVMDVNGLDLVYAPPVAPVYDPILIAAAQALKSV